MGELLFFLSLLAIFFSAFFVIAVVSSGKLDNFYYEEKSGGKDISQGDKAVLHINGKELQCVVEENRNDEDMMSSLITLRYLR